MKALKILNGVADLLNKHLKKTPRQEVKDELQDEKKMDGEEDMDQPSPKAPKFTKKK